MNAEKVIQFPVRTIQQPEKGGHVADLDDGYTRIANDLLDAVLFADLTARQIKVAMAVIRKTYGFNKKVDRISDSQIAEATGIHRTHVCKARISLLERKILIREGTKIGVNKVISEWKTPENQNSYSVANSATKDVAKPATKSVANLVHTKDKIQKTNKPKDLTSENSCESSDESLVNLPDIVPEKPKPKIRHPDAVVASPKGSKWGRADDLKAAEYIFQRVQVVTPGMNPPNWTDWANEIRLMCQSDNRTHREICELFRFASQHTFWCRNVLSPAKLRKQWDRLIAERQAESSNPIHKPTTSEQWAASATDLSWADDLWDRP